MVQARTDQRREDGNGDPLCSGTAGEDGPVAPTALPRIQRHGVLIDAEGAVEIYLQPGEDAAEYAVPERIQAVFAPGRLGQDAFLSRFDASAAAAIAAGLSAARTSQCRRQVQFCLAGGVAVSLQIIPDPSRAKALLLLFEVNAPITSSNRAPRPAADALATAEQLFLGLEALELGIALYSADDRLLYGNKRYCRLIPAASRDHMIGLSFEEIVALCASAGVYDRLPEPASAIRERIRAHRAAGQPFELELPDGSVERILERRTDWGGTVAIHVDVSDLYHARDSALAALRQSTLAEERLVAAIEAMPDGFVLWGQDERLVICNAKYRGMYTAARSLLKPGVAFERVIRATVDAGYYPDARGQEEAWIAAYLRAWRGGDLERTVTTPEGRHIRITNTKHAHLGTVSVHSDVTALIQARLDALRSEQAKSAFFANMSHEIRTPLTGIISLAEHIQEAPDAAHVRARSGTIVELGASLMTILNDVLDLAKLDAGKLSFAEEPICLRHFGQRIGALHAPLAHAKGLDFSVLVPPDIRMRRGDEGRLLQVINNLVANAVKFTYTGFVRVTFSDGSDDQLHVEVADSGLGIAEDALARIFQPFEQATRSTTQNFGGTGLGLSIVKSLVAAMKGEIEVRSRPGHGTRISVALPLPVITEAARVEVPPAPDPSLPARILIAEDNDIIREMLAVFLAKLGCSTVSAASGNEAVQRYQADPRFDLIFMDINMPDGDGPTALLALQAEAAARGLTLPPVVAITANAMADQVKAYLDAGFARCLPKPFLKADLQRCINDLVPGSNPAA